MAVISKPHSNRGGCCIRIPLRRLVGMAFFTWVTFMLYTYRVFQNMGPLPDGRQQAHDHPVIRGFIKKPFLIRTLKKDANGEFIIVARTAKPKHRTFKKTAKPAPPAPPDAEDNFISRAMADMMCARSIERDECAVDIMMTNDRAVANKFLKLMLDREQKDKQNNKNTVTLHDAKIACALAIERANCIHDVLATGDIESAEIYDKHPAELAHKQKMSQEQAKQACKMIHPEDQEKCQGTVMQLNDEETAKHYVHLMQDEEEAKEEVTEDDAGELCAKVENNQQQCLADVQTLHNKHVAEHYIALLHNSATFTDLVPRKDAEKLCNHLLRRSRGFCVHKLIAMSAMEAAKNFAMYAAAEKKIHNAEKFRLSEEKAIAICASEFTRLDNTPEQRKECEADLQTIFNVESARKYAQLLLDQKPNKVESGGDKQQKDVRAKDDSGSDEEPEDYQGEDDGSISQAQADMVCLKSNQQERCVHDVMLVKDMQVAQKYAKLLVKREKEKEAGLGAPDAVSMHDAKIACALAIERANCIHDVIGTGDLDSAEMYDKHPVEHAHKTKMTTAQAKQACKLVHLDDQEECQSHVMGLNDEETAKHYVHLLQDKEEAHDTVTEEEAKSLCTSLKLIRPLHDQCLLDLQKLHNKHVAKHYIELLGDSSAFSDLVSKPAAEKLCNHLVRKNRSPCVTKLITMNAMDAARHFSSLALAEKYRREAAKSPLDQEMAALFCAKEFSPLDNTDQQKKECENDLRKIFDVEVAQNYAQMLLERSPNDDSGDDDRQGDEAGEEEEVEADPKAESDVVMCIKSSQSQVCLEHVTATNDRKVGKKFAKLFLESEKRGDANTARAVTMHDAKIACALAYDKANCIHDVLGTGDIDSAEAYDKRPAEDAHKHKMTQEEAKQACKLIHKDDQEKCQSHVMALNDEETAKHYVHLLQDQEEENAPITEEEATVLCESLKRVRPQHEQCLLDVLHLHNKHVAEHYVELLHDSSKGLSDLVAQKDAEKLCNHLFMINQRQCAESLTKMNAMDAAKHYSELAHKEHQQKDITNPLVSKEQAAAICADEYTPPENTVKQKKECEKDLQTFTNLDMAKRYAQLLMEQTATK